MRNMKVSAKLIVGFLIVTLLTIVVGVTGIYGLTSMGNAADTMYSQKAKPLGDLAIAVEYFQRCRVQVRSAIIYTGDKEELQAIESDMKDRLTQFETAMANYQPTIATEKGSQLFSNIMDKYNSTFKAGILQVLYGAKQGAPQDVLLNEMAVTTDAADIIASDLAELVAARMEVMSTANDSNMALQRLLLIIIVAVIVVSASASMIFALYISRMISKPLNLMTSFLENIRTSGDMTLAKKDQDAMAMYSKSADEIGRCLKSCNGHILRLLDINEKFSKIADGDLSVGIEVLSEKDGMGLAITKMVDNLNSMFNDINSSASQVSAASRQIADGAQSLAQGATEQAAAIEELSSSIGEIANKTNENAKTAREAADLSNTIKNNAEDGNTQMEQMMQAVKEINEASKKISKVIKVIDDIAFQTNILALNAAVEAARAGQHGKGFAVVAEEVRDLAAKSADAAKDTGGLIANSIEKANLGLNIATETSASLKKIVEGIKQSSESVSRIAQSSDEQAAAISHINTGIEQVAQVVQKNSATAEESAAASEEMTGQSNILERLISRFTLKDADYGPLDYDDYSSQEDVFDSM